MRRPGAQASLARDDSAHELVGVQRALHEHLHLAFTSHLDGPDGGRAAIVDVNDLDGSQIELQGCRKIADLRFRTHKNRNDQFVLECLDRAAERYFVARPDNRGFHRRFGGRTRDQAKVVTIGIVHNELGTGKGGPAQLLHRRDELGGTREYRRTGAIACLAIECESSLLNRPWP